MYKESEFLIYQKPNLNNVSNVNHTIIYEDELLKNEFMNIYGNGVNHSNKTHKIAVNGKDKDFYEKQINNLSLKLKKLNEDNEKEKEIYNLLENENKVSQATVIFLIFKKTNNLKSYFYSAKPKNFKIIYLDSKRKT